MAVPPPLPADDKAPRRAAMRPARAAFASRATAAMRAALARHVREVVAGARLVGGYAASDGEPDVLAALVATHVPLALPVSGPAGTMRFVAWDGRAALVAGRYGIGEPPAGEAVVPDLLLVPLVGFDRAGRRLGRGGGYYDRWLAAHPGTHAIGVGWRMQEVPALADDDWDVPLAAIVTEAEVIRP